MSRTVNIGIIGTGYIAAVMAQTIRKTRHCRLYAVASRDIERAVAFGQKYGARKAYGSYKELVLDRKVQLVYVATPHSEHYENAKLCLEHGKHCLVEKPFTVNAKQAKELFSLAADNNLFISEAMWTRYLPFARKVKEVMDSGIVGTPVSISANLCENNKDRVRMTDPELAGGALLDLGIYPLTFTSMFFGDEILRINATCSYTDRHLDEQESIALVYRDGRMADLSAGMVGTGTRQGIINCTDGYLVVDNIMNFEALSVYNKDHQKIAYYKRPRQKSGYEYELAAAVRAVQTGVSETEELPHSQIISILHMMDFIRQQFGIIYPCEEEKQAPLAVDTGLTRQTAAKPDESIPEQPVTESGQSETPARETAAAGLQETSETANEPDIQEQEGKESESIMVPGENKEE